MSKRLLILLMLFISVNIMAVYAEDEEGEDEPPHWDYEEVDHWGELSPQYILCMDGTAQSPIDVQGALELNLADISFSYGATALSIFNNGHTIEVTADSGSSITYNEIQYDLAQFHFHHPSEHSVNGELADMEIHFVNKDPNGGGYAVVGVLLVEGEADNEAYADIFANLPPELSVAQATDIMVDLMSLLPETQTFYTYQGSLTTPPCSEVVRWLLLDTPVELSAAQIEAFAAIFEMNARHAQPVGERDLLHDSN
mgnify:CR=1 FL=1